MRGAIVQKPKGTGRWYVVLDLDRDGTGRRRQKWHSGFRIKREAEKVLTALLAAQDTGTYVAPQKITLGEYLAKPLATGDRSDSAADDVRRISGEGRWARRRRT